MNKVKKTNKNEAEVREFARLLVSGKAKTAPQAYAMVKQRDPNKTTVTDREGAQRYMHDTYAQELMQAMRLKYLEKSPEALRKEWALADDPATPPHVKAAIWDRIQNRAVPKVDITVGKFQHDHRFADFFPQYANLSKEELLAKIQKMLDEPESVKEIEARHKH